MYGCIVSGLYGWIVGLDASMSGMFIVVASFGLTLIRCSRCAVSAVVIAG